MHIKQIEGHSEAKVVAEDTCHIDGRLVCLGEVGFMVSVHYDR